MPPTESGQFLYLRNGGLALSACFGLQKRASLTDRYRERPRRSLMNAAEITEDVIIEVEAASDAEVMKAALIMLIDHENTLNLLK